MSLTLRESLYQRAEYTHQYNAKTGRHGWLRLTPAYSVKIVEELIEKCDRSMRIFDPFAGTATTALSAAYHGHEGVTTDINPFLVWLGKAKTANYAPATIDATHQMSQRAIEMIEKGQVVGAPAPPIHNIERWWSAETLTFLCQLRGAIETVSDKHSQERDLLLVAFCRTLIALSNASFNHQSMSFKDESNFISLFQTDRTDMFVSDIRFVLQGAADNPQGKADVLLNDSRDTETAKHGLFDRVITSPPYVNRMSYIRELRPYMYWLDYLQNGRDAGELDWTAIGGTWGIATSRLTEWQRIKGHFQSEALEDVIDRVAHQDNKNGRLLATYITKYFDDMWSHFQSLPSILMPGAETHYIVGNSTFYGVLLSVEEIYAAMLEKLGFHDIECRPIRKRNSKKELIEFDVKAIWK